jgi:probable addiction module antidote protein
MPRKFDPVNYLDTEESIANYVRLAAEREDKEHLLACLSDAMRARAVNQIAEETGIDREKIREMFSGEARPPSRPVLTKVAKAVAGAPLKGASGPRRRIRDKPLAAP